MKKTLISSSIAAAVLIAGASLVRADGGGTITGKITLKGTPPGEKTIDMAADAACKALHDTAPTTHRYSVGADGALKDVFVYVKSGPGVDGKTFDAPKTKVLLNQKGCLYDPYVTGIMVGQELEIVNDDNTLHNVHALPTNNEEFNKGQPVQGMKFDHKFSKPEIMVKFKCDVHPWMFAYIGVVPHPYFDTTSDAGTFTIKDVPPGDYVLEIWHLKAGTQTANVKVTAGGSTTQDFTLEAK